MLEVKHMLQHLTGADQRDWVKPLNVGTTADRLLTTAQTRKSDTSQKASISAQKGISKPPQNAEIQTRWECALAQERWRHELSQIWIWMSFESALQI